MKMEKWPIPGFCPLFSTCNHILRYLLTPWGKKKTYLTFRTTNNKKKRIFLKNVSHHSGFLSTFSMHVAC